MSTGEIGGDDGEDYTPMVSAIIEAVADQEGVDPAGLEPSLYEILDPDALNALFAPTATGHARPGGRVEFTYGGYNVTAYSDGRVRVQDLVDASDGDTATADDD